MKFSFIVAAYNIEKYIQRCIESLINQTYKDYEIIVVNDGSTDTTFKILEKYKSYIKIINKKNGGLSSARNAGLINAQGDYCVFIDGDDYVDNTYLEKFNNNLKDSPDIVFGGYIRETRKGRKEYMFEEFFNEKNYFNLYKCMVGPSMLDEKRFKMTIWGNAYKRSFLLENDIKFKNEKEYISEDLVFHSDIAVNVSVKSVVCLNCGYHYVDNGYLSLTKVFKNDRLKKELQLRSYLLDVAKAKKYNEVDLFRIHYNFLCRLDIVLQYKFNKRKEIIEILAKSDVVQSIDYCRKFKISLKKKIRIFYMYRKKVLLMKLINFIK